MLCTATARASMLSGSTTNSGYASLGKTATPTKSRSRIITRVRSNGVRFMTVERRRPAAWAIHPGEVLQEEFLKPMDITGYRLAKSLGVRADMAVRLARFFGTSPEFWMNLQSAYELAKARTVLGHEIAKIQPRQTAA